MLQFFVVVSHQKQADTAAEEGAGQNGDADRHAEITGNDRCGQSCQQHDLHGSISGKDLNLDVALVMFLHIELFQLLFVLHGPDIPDQSEHHHRGQTAAGTSAVAIPCGMPVIAAASGESKRVIEEAECGICSPSGDEEALAESIEKMMQCTKEEINKMKQNARKYFEDHFDKKKLLDEIDQYFK